ncbi:hypothetical protein B0H63DRAFT_523816 [Podospora didyma]|uniref:Uncharacterized protein n=1 Tax=Podospora didyma TaxID=330526 RepID=A0AAE0TVG5_9PEZI|nr:hypothetical protein B0H63DRAFT_523816 [Podospora didyma]
MTICNLLLPEAFVMVGIHELSRALRLRKALRRRVPGWETFSLKQSFVVWKGLLYNNNNNNNNNKETSEKIYPEDMLRLAANGRLSFANYPADSEIKDRDKRDWTLKLLAISQTLYMTAAYAFCGFITTVVCFRCPQDIHAPFAVEVAQPAENRAHHTSDQSSEAEIVAVQPDNQVEAARPENLVNAEQQQETPARLMFRKAWS